MLPSVLLPHPENERTFAEISIASKNKIFFQRLMFSEAGLDEEPLEFSSTHELAGSGGHAELSLESVDLVASTRSTSVSKWIEKSP